MKNKLQQAKEYFLHIGIRTKNSSRYEWALKQVDHCQGLLNSLADNEELSQAEIDLAKILIHRAKKG